MQAAEVADFEIGLARAAVARFSPILALRDGDNFTACFNAAQTQYALELEVLGKQAENAALLAMAAEALLVPLAWAYQQVNLLYPRRIRLASCEFRLSDLQSDVLVEIAILYCQPDAAHKSIVQSCFCPPSKLLLASMDTSRQAC